MSRERASWNVLLSTPTSLAISQISSRRELRSLRPPEEPDQNAKTPWPLGRAFSWQNCSTLEQVPQELVVDVVVILHLGRLHKGSQQTRAAVRRRLLQICVATLHVFAEKLRRPVCFAEVRQRVVDVVGQVALRLSQVLDLRRLAVDTRLED